MANSTCWRSLSILSPRTRTPPDRPHPSFAHHVPHQSPPRSSQGASTPSLPDRTRLSGRQVGSISSRPSPLSASPPSPPCSSSYPCFARRTFLQETYLPLKAANPDLKVLIREAEGVSPRAFARFGASSLPPSVSSSVLPSLADATHSSILALHRVRPRDPDLPRGPLVLPGYREGRAAHRHWLGLLPGRLGRIYDPDALLLLVSLHDQSRHFFLLSFPFR